MRIVLLTFESPQSDEILRRILETFGPSVCGIVRSDVLIAGKSLAQALAFMARRTGLGFVARKGLEVVAQRIPRGSAARRSRPPSLRELAGLHRIAVHGSRAINRGETVEVVSAWQPDLLVSVNMNQRIGPALLAVPSLGTINVHGSLLPRNRGLFPYFWALANGDAESGATIHWVAEGFDTGEIILQRAFPIEPEDTVTAVAWKSTHAGADLVVAAMDLIATGSAARRSQDERHASYHSWPTRADVAQLHANGRRYGGPWDGYTPRVVRTMPARVSLTGARDL